MKESVQDLTGKLAKNEGRKCYHSMYNGFCRSIKNGHPFPFGVVGMGLFRDDRGIFLEEATFETE